MNVFLFIFSAFKLAYKTSLNLSQHLFPSLLCSPFEKVFCKIRSLSYYFISQTTQLSEGSKRLNVLNVWRETAATAVLFKLKTLTPDVYTLFPYFLFCFIFFHSLLTLETTGSDRSGEIPQVLQAWGWILSSWHLSQLEVPLSSRQDHMISLPDLPVFP